MKTPLLLVCVFIDYVISFAAKVIHISPHFRAFAIKASPSRTVRHPFKNI